MSLKGLRGLITKIERYMIHDGPGIRTVVFMRGCPLRCMWCSSPQTWEMYREVIYVKGNCVGCNSCIEACPENAIVLQAERRRIERERCTECGRCIEVCPSGALRFVGVFMSVEEVLNTVLRDEKFYRKSGGGVTISGGEPAIQDKFVREILYRCKERGIHTALETSGFVEWGIFREILKDVDLLLIDIKHMDSEVHLKHTGKRNELILNNIRRASREKLCSITIRYPLIPEHNDSMENINAIVEFMRETGVARIDVFPFHKLGEHEYEELGMDYKARDIQVPASQDVQKVKELFQVHGIEVTG